LKSEIPIGVGDIMKTRFHVFVLVLATCFLTVPLLAQTQQTTTGIAPSAAPTPDASSGRPVGGFGQMNPYNLLQK
jgi:hypothetical protein